MDLSIDELVCIAQLKPLNASKKRKSQDFEEKTSATAEPIIYPYSVTDDDHCETPAQAYIDIASILKSLALLIGKTAETLKVYDPYFCEGSVIERMGSIGFKTVHNMKEDFYQAHAENRLPDYDVLVTNPPYSGTNMERLLRICVASGKPWLLLMPNYVYTKDYYAEVVRPCSAPVFYVVPSKSRYLYTTPKGRRQEKSGKYTAPFPTFWYCNLGSHQKEALRRANTGGSDGPAAAVVLALSARDIPVESAPDNDPRRKKARNAQKRAKNKGRKKQQQQQRSSGSGGKSAMVSGAPR